MPRDFLPSLQAALLLAAVAVMLDIHRVSGNVVFSPLAICDAACCDSDAPLVRSHSVYPTQRPVLRRCVSIPIDNPLRTDCSVGQDRGSPFLDNQTSSYEFVISDRFCGPFGPDDKANFTQATSNAVIYFTSFGIFKIHSASSISLAPPHFQMTRASPFYLHFANGRGALTEMQMLDGRGFS